ncbi:WD repeat and SOCS box-containing protein 2 [Protopterus annectens]|uniref:WD repeat and SOCS box-containing protein 2 n=1 Tax=Protopterus annectens TaxID=7888 RepID=UPI001CF9FADB|nr:WD repeat and SOCS box-containing protein 2 [Protopterus annectens]
MEKGFENRDKPALLAELIPEHAHQSDRKSGCETWSVSFSPDGSYFAWSQGHCLVKLVPWPLSSTLDLGNKCSEHKGSNTKLSRNGISDQERTLDCGHIVWGLAFGACSSSQKKQNFPNNHQGPKFELLRLVLATGLTNGHIKVWEVQTGCILFDLVGHQDVVRHLAFAPNGSLLLVSASRDKTLCVWDLKRDGKQIHVLSGHKQWVYCCSISPDSSMLSSVAGEKSVLLWSMRSYKLIRKLKGHESSVVSCDFSPDGALLATASYDAHVIVWDPYTGESLTKLKHLPLCPALNYTEDFQDGAVRSISFSPEGLYLATVADDRLLRLWALELWTIVDVAPVTNGLCSTFFPHGGIIAAGTRDGHVQFWEAPRILPSLRHLCRKAVRRFLTTYQVMTLPFPKKMKEFLTYRTL